MIRLHHAKMFFFAKGLMSVPNRVDEAHVAAEL